MTAARMAILMGLCLLCLSQCYLDRLGVQDALGELFKTGRVPDVQQHIKHPSHRNRVRINQDPATHVGRSIIGDRMLSKKENNKPKPLLRCKHCNKRLADGTARDLIIRCPRCKQDSHFKEVV